MNAVDCFSVFSQERKRLTEQKMKNETFFLNILEDNFFSYLDRIGNLFEQLNNVLVMRKTLEFFQSFSFKLINILQYVFSFLTLKQ